MMRPTKRAPRRTTFSVPLAAAVVALWFTLLDGAIAAEYRSTVEPATVWYDAPSTKSKQLFVLGSGYPLEVMVTLEGWTKVRDASAGIGWVEARALGPRRTVMVKPEMAEVRSAPEATAPVAFRVGRRVLLEWVENLPSGWVRVRHAEGGTGYVRSADVFGA
jgi:SH3-like domain-containing protein